MCWSVNISEYKIFTVHSSVPKDISYLLGSFSTLVCRFWKLITLSFYICTICSMNLYGWMIDSIVSINGTLGIMEHNITINLFFLKSKLPVMLPFTELLIIDIVRRTLHKLQIYSRNMAIHFIKNIRKVQKRISTKYFELAIEKTKQKWNTFL